jgi:HipA-like protein
MRSAVVFVNGTRAGVLREVHRQRFHFQYDEPYRLSPNTTAISLTLPKTQPEFTAQVLFACFASLLPEGHNRTALVRSSKLDPLDAFGLLLAAAQHDTVGSITVSPLDADAPAYT